MERSQKIIKIFSSAFGILFLIIGAIMITVSAGANLRMINSRRVNARIVEVIETHSKPRKDYERILYTPVYEYYDGGEVRTYESPVSTSMPVEMDGEVTLYISENGIIYEKRGILTTLFMGILFAALGYFFAFINVKRLRKKFAETDE